ncbi:V-type proton ATPase subunit a -like protein, partial [Brachionus plicatilis]
KFFKMSSLFRGEDMTLCQIYFQSEAAYSCVAQLGELGIVQFRDLNPTVNAFQRKYVNEVRRCEEMERKLRFLESEILKEKEIPLAEAQEFCEAPKSKEMIEMEAALEQLEHDLQEVNSNKDALKKNYLELQELRHILTKATTFFEEQDRIQTGEQTVLQMETQDRIQPLRLGFLAGVIDRERVPSFELMLWRICRGNVFLRTAEIEETLEDPKTNTQVNKTVFILFFQGEQLKTKVKKICEGFKATIYPCPETASERREMGLGVMTRLEELKTVLDQSLNLRKSLLTNAALNVKTWFCRVRKMKAIYHTMNMFNLEVNQKCLIAECWAPVNELTRIKLALDKGTELSGSNIQSILNRMETKEQPPTHHRLNKFSEGFQNIVDAYGISSYREINPAPFTVITFPFLFAVMFGDAGHGLIMSLFALFMVLRESQLKNKFRTNEVWQIFFGGRYIILLMGLFSIYTGVIYNDVFSKSMNIFGSSWRVGVTKDFDFEKVTVFDLNPNTNANHSLNEIKMYSGNPYPFGVDPIWIMSINKIAFTNSLKMKFSVIIGIMQMMFGLVLSLLNHLFFGKMVSVLFEFIPQVIFLTFIFVYLCVMILIKWLRFDGSPDSTQCAPNLLIELINMFFFKSAADEDPCKALYSGQSIVQKILIVLAVLCIPTMLLGKPIVLYLRHKRKSQIGQRLSDSGHLNPIAQEDSTSDSTNEGVDLKIMRETPVGKDSPDTSHDDENENFDMGELAVEQCIHTIEYFLGCISHTASYLRLWALSLAHAELSEVLWTMILRIGLKSGSVPGFVILWLVFVPWAAFTIGVLLLMEGLSAFLHALRLHWVEFQSKFYKGEGYQFMPFSFEQILEQAENPDKI